MESWVTPWAVSPFFVVRRSGGSDYRLEARNMSKLVRWVTPRLQTRQAERAVATAYEDFIVHILGLVQGLEGVEVECDIDDVRAEFRREFGGAVVRKPTQSEPTRRGRPARSRPVRRGSR